MKIKVTLFLALGFLVLLLSRCGQTNSNTKGREKIVHVADTVYDVLNINGKVNFKFTGADGIPYYFTMSDTVPTLPYSIPHILLSQGNPIYLHSVLALDNNTRSGDDSMNAIIGLVDNSGTTNNVLKATPNEIGIQTTLAGDTSGGAYFGFTKNGIEFKRGEGNSFERMFLLSNHKGTAGQILTLSAGDTAQWRSAPSMTQQYFAPANGQAISIVRSAYNIINPASGLLSLTIKLPDSPNDNDWFELTFTQTVKSVLYNNGRVANNAIKTASLNNYYKKFVFRKADMTWY